jgi:patatin-related protein
MPKPTFKKPEEFRKETRLGLVVYGGIALAIYMNGICREFYNAVRGRSIYKLVKALTDSDIVVDIISGTSAGGINGVLLSYALTNSTKEEVVDFADFARIWRESGDILKLMRKPSSSNLEIDSVLNGEVYYQQQLVEAFQGAYQNKHPAPENEWLSDVNELDLFVTGTDILGRVYQIFDDTGCLIEIKDHHAVFQLKYRQDRREPFKPSGETHQSLAKLCRITSCFPVAFPVVDVVLERKNGIDNKLQGKNKIDGNLAQWGQLEKRDLPESEPIGGYSLYFVDGGVLDNRPFSYTIKEMYYRTAYRPVDRKLFYIDPSPDRFADDAQFKNMSKPNTLQVIGDSLVGIPMYESIGKDLESIKEHNEKVRRYKSLVRDAEVIANSEEANSDTIDIKETIYLRSRLISLRDRILPLVLGLDQYISPSSEKQVILQKIATLLADKASNNEDKKNLDRIRKFFGKQIRDLDVEYCLRKHFYLLQNLCTKLEHEPNAKEYENIQKLSKNIARNIKLLEVIRSSLELGLSNLKVSESFYHLFGQERSSNKLRMQFYRRLLRLHRFLLDVNVLDDSSLNDNSNDVPGNIFQVLPLQAKEVYAKKSSDWLSKEQLSSIFDKFKKKLSKFSNQNYLKRNIWSNARFKYNHKKPEAFVTILRQIELASESLIKDSQLNDWQEVLGTFRSFRDLDRVVYPFEYLTNLTSREIIQTIRISPNDAQRGFGENKKLEDKLAGETLYAFGGFFKKSWRSNDILWGRLDGLNRIVEALLTVDSVRKFPEFLKQQARQHQSYEVGFDLFKKEYFEFLVDESFPNKQLSEENYQEIIRCLEKLSNPNQQILTDDKLNKVLDKLISLLVIEGHREIVNSDLKNVLEDAITEQFNWNRQMVKSKNFNQKKNKNSEDNEEVSIRYQTVPGYFDQSVSALAARTLAKEAIGNLSSHRDTEDFFRKQYTVGGETVLESIPTIVLANISTRFSLIFRNIMLTTLGDRSEYLRRSLIYNVLNKSLQLFYWWLQLISPSAVITSKFSKKQPIVLGLQLFLLIIATVGVVIVVTQFWIWLLVIFMSAVLCWLLERPWKKVKKK